MAVWREGVQEEISKQSTSTAAVGVVIVLFYFRSNIAMNHALQGYQVSFFFQGEGQAWLGRNEIIDGRGSSANRARSESFDYIGIFTRKATMERGTGEEEGVEAQL